MIHPLFPLKKADLTKPAKINRRGETRLAFRSGLKGALKARDSPRGKTFLVWCGGCQDNWALETIILYIWASSKCRDFCYSVQILCNRAILWYKSWISKVYSGTFFQKLQAWKYHKMRSLKKAMNQMKPWKRGHGSYLFDPSCVNDFYPANSNAPFTQGALRGVRLGVFRCQTWGSFFVGWKVANKNRGFWNPFSVFVP